MSELITQDSVQEFFAAALAALPYPVSQPPGDAAADTYITFNEAAGIGRTAGNTATRVRHLVQLHAWPRLADGAHRAAVCAASAALTAAGVRVYSWGPDLYENDTGIRHISCTCSWWQRPAAG